MELAYAISRPELFRERPAVAVVLWERQGDRRAVVPPSAWWTPAEDQHGLQGVYALHTPAGPVEFTRVDPSLEFVWSGGALLHPRSAELRQRLQEQWYTRMRTWETWAAWEHGEAARSDAWVGARDAFLASLTLAQQREWLEQLQAHPAVLADATPRAAQQLYRGCRLGAPDEALRMISQWAQAHADEAPDLTADFYAAQRAVYRQLAQQLVWQYRPHLAAFAEAALELPDGGCALPAAYTLAYASWTQGQLGDWIAQLDARLASAQLVGDRRVNWLLARAQAEEIRLSPVGRDTWTVDRFLAGRGWLEEAVLTAQEEATRLRAYRELTARYAADEQWSAADQSWDAAAGRCSGASSQALIAAWRAQLADLPAAAAARRAAQEQQAQESYVARLRARYAGAVARGDAESMSRYRARLAAAGASVP